MKFILLKISLALTMLLSLSGCFLFPPSIDHTGLMPVDIMGQVYTVNCRVVIDHEDDIGVPVTAEITELPQVCSNDAPEAALLFRACEAVTNANQANYQMTRGPTAMVSFFEPVSSSLEESADPCFIPAGTEVGEGEVISRTDMLSNSASSELRPDEIGKILPKNSLTNSLAVLSNSEVRVGAKFASWRYANTTASGDISFDRFNCDEDNTCDVVFRQISLKFEDFTIVRPTIFARDVKLRDVRLYSVTSHSVRTDSEGRFKVNGVNAIITSVVNGEKVTLLSSQDLQISGQFNHNLHEQAHAALTMQINVKEANSNVSINADAYFKIKKFPSKLASNLKNPMCLTGGALAIYREARVSKCSLKQPYQAWYLEEKGRYLRIRQPLNNTCLNVKSGSQNYDGGIVSIVNCSDHFDQLWAIDNDFNVVNLNTGKCLDVGRNHNRGEDDLVTIHTCEIKAGGQDWSVLKPS